MLNLGLIGDIRLMEPYIKRALEHPEIHITGKSSVGIHPQPDDFRLSVPEFNRIELIERSDALLINRFSLLSFEMVCSMAKKSKHFFATTHPAFTPEQCMHLDKLAREGKTVIQISNPFYYFPAIQWLNRNLRKPAFLSVSRFKNEMPDNDLLIRMLLMLKDITGAKAKKTGIISFQSQPADSIYHHLTLEFSNGLSVSIQYGKMEKPETFELKSYAQDQFATFDLISGTGFCNHQPVNLSDDSKGDETDAFIQAILHGKSCSCGIEDYAAVLQTAGIIRSKLEQLDPHQPER
jgi:hypothetical protein